MPHVIVKMHPGKTEAQKNKLAAEITNAVMDITKNAASSVSVSIEDIGPDDWVEKVYKADILNKWDTLYKKLGYNPL